MLLVDNNCYRKKKIAVYTNHSLFTGGSTTEDLEMTVVLALYFVMLISQCVSETIFCILLQELCVKIYNDILFYIVSL